MKMNNISHKFVEFIPEQLDDGVLYISRRFHTAAHNCCCGCGEEVITPLNPTDWSLRIIGQTVSLYPSIGNWSFACRSHYWIRNSKIVWSCQMDQKEIERGREIDRRIKMNYYDTVNSKKGIGEQQSTKKQPEHSGMYELINSILATIKRWWKSL